MSAPAAGVVTLMAMQLSTVAGMKGVRLLNVLESAARWRLGLCGKSALLVSFAVVLPLALALCAVYGMLLARSPPDRIGPVVDWAAPVAIVLAPLLLVPAVAAAFCFRNMTISEVGSFFFLFPDLLLRPDRPVFRQGQDRRMPVITGDN